MSRNTHNTTTLNRFQRELGAFLEDVPHGFPDEALQNLIQLQKNLESPQETKLSPGQQAIKYAQEGTTGTGVHFSKAATGVDVPSSGQTE